MNTYTYDTANRLVTVTNATTSSGYAYNGLGDRLQQTVNGQTTTYTLDLNTSLTQVLSDGQYAYLYGNGRIAQETSSSTEYFLGDALGSVRQLADSNAEITLAKSYDPYGQVLSSVGDGESAFAYTGEAMGANGLTYLRARYYAPWQGRFVSRDTWGGNLDNPVSYNKWLYGYANPIKNIDPSGYITVDEARDAWNIVMELKRYHVNIVYDWGYIENGITFGILPLPPYLLDVYGWNCSPWQKGVWELGDLEAVRNVIGMIKGGIEVLGGNYYSLVGSVSFQRLDEDNTSTTTGNLIKLRNHINNSQNVRARTITHEIGHVIINVDGVTLSYFMEELGTTCKDSSGQTLERCYGGDEAIEMPGVVIVGSYDPGLYAGEYLEYLPSKYARSGNQEDFAETFAAVVSSTYLRSGKGKSPYLEAASLVSKTFNQTIKERRTVMAAILSGQWRQP